MLRKSVADNFKLPISNCKLNNKSNDLAQKFRRTFAMACRSALLLLSTFFAGCAASENFDGGLLAKSSSADYSAAVKELDEAAAMISRLEYSAAMQKLDPIVRPLQQAGDVPRAAEAQFWIAYCYEKTGKSSVARTAYQLVISRYPQTPSAKQARDRLDIIDGP